MRSLLLIVAATLLRASPVSGQESAGTDSIHRLEPRVFRELPPAVRRDLETRTCRVPQPWDARTAQNVAHGAFTAARVNEWAILCSVRGASTILIYRVARSAEARVVDSLRPSSDNAWVQGIGGGRFGYSRVIQTRSRISIRRWRVDVDGQPIPQPIDHDAIEDVFEGKAAEAFYYARGRWHRQVTAD